MTTAANPDATLRVRALAVLAAAGPWAGVLLPHIGAAAAVYQVATRGVGAFEIGALVVMYCLTMLGITLGYHRLFAHHAFAGPAATRAVFAVLGSMALQGPVLWWASIHRRHHQHTDKVDDPHTPYPDGNPGTITLRGLWFSHIGWLFRARSVRDRGFLHAFQTHTPDLMRDRVVFFVHMTYWEWVGLGLALPAIAGGLWYGSWDGVLRGFIWGGLLRIFLVSHVMWSVNTICHSMGSRPYASRGLPGNVAALAPSSFGEAWHNQHHAFPTSARFGLAWWQLDLGYLCLRTLSLLGLVSAIKVPTAADRARKLAMRASPLELQTED